MIQINVEEYQTFVVKISKLYKRPGVDIRDAVSIANQALIHAAIKFDPTRETEFKNYAFKVIKHRLWKMRPVTPECEVQIEQELVEPDEHRELSRKKEILSEVLDRLPERERFVIKQSFGIDCEAKTYKEIAPLIGVNFQRVAQLKTRGLYILKTLMASEQDNA